MVRYRCNDCNTFFGKNRKTFWRLYAPELKPLYRRRAGHKKGLATMTWQRTLKIPPSDTLIAPSLEAIFMSAQLTA